jgi:hypothetical protein
MDYTPVKFIGEEIEVSFDKTPQYEKMPPCPDGFRWQGEDYRVIELLNEWRDFSRKGEIARNMQPQHARRASVVGSWGVGRFFFRVKVESGKIFDLYYDRSVKDVNHRKGSWRLFRELVVVSGGDQ